jgi:putative endonuclease
MSFSTYILKSINHKRYYIGSAEDEAVRLKRHNKGLVKSTKGYRPWKIVYIEYFKTRQEAYRRELEIKRYKGGEAFKKLIHKNK